MAVAKQQPESNVTPLHGDVDPVVVGQRVKALREAMQLSLRDLAERSGVSAPMLSQVERGETSPTLSVAARIARGLDLSLSQLLRLDEGQHVVIVTKDQRRQGPASAKGHTYEMITPPLEHIGMLDWKDWQRAIDAGYRHTIALLEARARKPAPAATMRG